MNTNKPYEIVRDEVGQFHYVYNWVHDRRIKPQQEDSDYQAFLTWNEKQNPPLDTRPLSFRDDHFHFSKEDDLVNHCKTHGIILYADITPNGFSIFPQSPQLTFPEKGRLCLLSRLVAGPTTEEDGVVSTWSNIWVTPELLESLQPKLQDEDSA